MSRFLHLLLIISLLGLAGCRDDISAPGPEEENFTGIRLSLPSNAAISRAVRSGNPEAVNAATEGKIHSLFFFAFPQSEGDKQVTVLSGEDLSGSITQLSSSDYTSRDIELKAGLYRFYIVANLPSPSDPDQFLTPAEAEALSEPQVKALSVSYPEAYTADINPYKGLPMGCTHTAFRCDDATLPADGLRILPGKSSTLFADLSFTVAKVRVNFINDTPNYMECKGVEFSSLSTSVNIFNGPGADGYGTRTAPLSRNARYFSLPDGAIGDLDPASSFSAAYANSHGAFVAQVIAYIPERILAGDDADSQSRCKVTIADAAAKEKTADFPLGGEPGENGAVPEAPLDLRRSHLYEYTIQGDGEVELSTTLWTPETVHAHLNWPTALIVDRTSIGSDFAPVSGTTPIDLYYYSNNEVSFRSEIQASSSLPYLRFVKMTDPVTSKTFCRVTVNPDVNAQNDLVHTYFYVIAGNLEKKIPVTIDFREYLVASPERVDIKITDYRNVTECELPYEFATNLEKLTCEVSHTSDMYLTESAVFTSGWPEGGDYSVNINADGLTNIGKSGHVTVKLSDTHDPTHYNHEAMIRLHFTASPATTSASGKLEADVYLHIIPASTTNYIIHFKTSQGWSAPHTYIYQHLEKYVDGHLEDVMCAYDPDAHMYENAIVNSITGGVTFKGWSFAVDKANSFDNQGYRMESDFFFDNGSKVPNPAYFSTAINYMSEHVKKIADGSSGTCDCTTGGAPRKWPGILMQKEEDGWWRIELPDVCQPGKTLIMFSSWHGGGDATTGRYPNHLVPGVPLFDFDDREGWFYYDPNDATHEFTDDKPTAVTPPEPEKATIYYDVTDEGWTSVCAHYWGNSGDPVSEWPGVKMTKIKDGIWKITIPAVTTVMFDNSDGTNTNPSGKHPASGGWPLQDGHVYTKDGDQGLYSAYTPWTPPAPKYDAPFTDAIYLRGAITDWYCNNNYKFSWNETKGVFELDFTTSSTGDFLIGSDGWGVKQGGITVNASNLNATFNMVNNGSDAHWQVTGSFHLEFSITSKTASGQLKVTKK